MSEDLEDYRDLPDGLSLTGKMVWYITRGCTARQAAQACRIPARLGEEIAARPLTQEAIRRLRSMAVHVPGPVVITAADELEWAEREPGEPLQ